MIKNIVFDVGDVLVHFGWDQVWRDLGNSEESVDRLREQMIRSDCWHRLDEGTINKADALEHFCRELPDLADSLRELWDHYAEFVREYRWSLPMIRGLKEKGYKIYLLSNYPEEFADVHWPTFTFLPEVDGYIISAKVKLTKPDLAIYRKLCSTYDLNPEECLFVDDRMENVIAAAEIGMTGKLFTGEETALELMNTMAEREKMA